MIVIVDEFRNRLDTALANNDMKPIDLARATGIAESTISQYRSGYSTPKSKRLALIANALHVSPAWLMGLENDTDVKVKGERSIPLFAFVSAGFGCVADENVVGSVDLPTEYGDCSEYFALTIRGDSMMPRIPDESIVIAHRQDNAEDGEIVIAVIDGEQGVCKRLRIHGNGIALESLNPAYEPKYFCEDEIEELPVRILGTVKEVRFRL